MNRLSIPITAQELSTPITQGHHADELEAAMSAIFENLLNAGVVEQLDDLHNFGTPYLGSPKVVENFTKLNGLAVLRRRNDPLSNKAMAIILQNWQALASERGIDFLKFVLQMIYPNQSQIVQLWHEKGAKLAEYPVHCYDNPSPNRFLTSRLRIYMKDSVDAAELGEVAPVLRRLVPWHIVPELAFRANAYTEQGVALGANMESYKVLDFSPDFSKINPFRLSQVSYSATHKALFSVSATRNNCSDGYRATAITRTYEKIYTATSKISYQDALNLAKEQAAQDRANFEAQSRLQAQEYANQYSICELVSVDEPNSPKQIDRPIPNDVMTANNAHAFDIQTGMVFNAKTAKLTDKFTIISRAYSDDIGVDDYDFDAPTFTLNGKPYTPTFGIHAGTIGSLGNDILASFMPSEHFAVGDVLGITVHAGIVYSDGDYGNDSSTRYVKFV